MGNPSGTGSNSGADPGGQSMGGTRGSGGGATHGGNGGNNHSGEGGKRKKKRLIGAGIQTHFVEGQGPQLGTLLNPAYQFQIDAQKKRQAADLERRKKIKPIADPEAKESERRKKASKRRREGRLGTLLSNPETLG